MRGCLLSAVAFCAIIVVAQSIDLPAGLRPAKAVGDREEGVIPGVNDPQPETPPNVRTPPNLSLRSRMIAALNSPEEKDRSQEVERRRHPTSDEVLAAAAKAPLVFQKGNKKQTTPKYTAPVVPRVTQSPPVGKNYGVNTIVQTNLVDSKGRIMKGINRVPIRVGPSVPAAPTSRATASRVEAEDDAVVPIEFGSKQSLI
uniref:Secreted protein n=1 Tax=Panagrellus redivivus TaxID=6233 RepID=A0A7E4UUF1_PANRE